MRKENSHTNEFDPELGLINPMDRGGVPPFLVGAVAQPDKHKIHGLKTKEDRSDFAEVAMDLEVKEADIIHELYAQHFVPKGQKSRPKQQSLSASSSRANPDHAFEAGPSKDTAPPFHPVYTPMQGEDQGRIISQYLNSNVEGDRKFNTV